MEIVGQLFSAGKDRHKKNVPEALERFGTIWNKKPFFEGQNQSLLVIFSIADSNSRATLKQVSKCFLSVSFGR